jgi:hypothetical protein
VRARWHDVQSYWLAHLGQYRETLSHLPGAAVYALVEDGLFEGACWYPTALFARSLWDTRSSDAALLQQVAAAPDVVLA